MYEMTKEQMIEQLEDISHYVYQQEVIDIVNRAIEWIKNN